MTARGVLAALCALAAAPGAASAAGDLGDALRDGSFFSRDFRELGVFRGEKARWVEKDVQLRVAKPEFTLCGASVGETLVTLDSAGRPVAARISLFNRGDMGGTVTEETFPAFARAAAARLETLFGRPGARFDRKTDPTKPDHDVEGLAWRSEPDAPAATPHDAATTPTAAFADASLEWAVRRKGVAFAPAAEWLRLDISRPGTLGAAGAAPARGGARRTGPARPERAPDGTVELRGVPMVDQGEKGYCAAATVARIMAWYGLDFLDQHQIAGWVASDPRTGTSHEAMMDGLGRVLHDRYGLVFRKLPGVSLDLLDFVKTYNKAAKREDMPQVEVFVDPETNVVQGESILRQFDAGLFLRLRGGNPAKTRNFLEHVRKAIDAGRPLAWSVVLGFARENPALPQAFGGHMRLIVGYNEREGSIVYTDSWGAGHERKTMPLRDAVAISSALYSIAPTLNR